ncbi:uncharacterized protein LOC128242276 [Mya arenaria]|uniref:uncharacterized protein LOC128242276 n=1 Tax=Mya arenaria TaxID=6604 RepID=UPI0022E27C2C|nr:uncharacterized protein LOC128242276 [Mya arenaria]
MKTLLCIVGAVVAIAHFANAEQCSDTADCITTQCFSTHHKYCQQRPGYATGLCTCSVGEETCVYKSDCTLPAYPELNCPDDARHCEDSQCICDRFPIGIGK